MLDKIFYLESKMQLVDCWLPGSTLRAVATLSATTDHIDKEECARRNIKVLSCPPPDLSAQADLTVALILLTLRNAAEGEYCLLQFSK